MLSQTSLSFSRINSKINQEKKPVSLLYNKKITPELLPHDFQNSAAARYKKKVHQVIFLKPSSTKT